MFARYLAVLFSVLLGPLFSLAQIPAAVRILSGTVESAEGKHLGHVTVRIANVGEDVTSDSGQFSIRLPAGLGDGFPVVFSVDGWVVMDPYSGARGRMNIPQDKRAPIQIVVSKSGSASLFSQQQITHMVEEIVSRLRPKETAQASGVDSLAEKAKEIGVTPERLKSAVDDWSHKASAPYDKGLAALQEQKYAEASRFIEESINPADPGAAAKYISLGSAEYYQGHYPRAEAALLKARELEPNNSKVLSTLGIVLRSEGKYQEAGDVLKKALEFEGEVPGVVNMDRAAVLNNLAANYGSQGRYAEAEPAFREALAIVQKGLGPEDPRVAQYLRNLGGLYDLQSKYRDAESLLNQALEIDKKVVGPESTAVAHDLNTLGAVYYHQHRYSDAEPLLVHALEINEKELGDDHPDVANSLSSLGTLYSSEKRNAEAEPLLKRALEIREKTLGPDHPKVAVTLNNLAGVYYEEKKYSVAEESMKRALAIHQKVNGPDHPDVGTDWGNLGEVYDIEGKFDEAEAAYARALEIEKKVQQREYPNVAIATNRLALFYAQRGDYAKAEPLFRQVLAIAEKALGGDHANIAAILGNLAFVLHQLKRDDEAKAYEERAATIRTKAGRQP